jgi:hypothetical protein
MSWSHFVPSICLLFLFPSLFLSFLSVVHSPFWVLNFISFFSSESMVYRDDASCLGGASPAYPL